MAKERFSPIIVKFSEVYPWQVVERITMPGNYFVKIPNSGNINACAVIQKDLEWKDPSGQNIGTSALCIPEECEVRVIDPKPNLFIWNLTMSAIPSR